MSDRLFLGIEVSTQQVKVIAVDDELQVTHEASVKFDADLSEFKTEGGVHQNDDGVTVTAPTLMWLKAIDLALQRLKSANFPFHKVAALSGTGQQHGSVYWKYGASEKLRTLKPDFTLYEQLKECFALTDSPVWMDSSTDVQCQRLEQKLGGPLEVSRITGCRAYHRMTGNQIAKIYDNNPTAYHNTERISLVSSFTGSLFLSAYMPIDESDGSGMNLLDLNTRTWSAQCIEAYGVPGLESKLGDVVKSVACLGSASGYMIKRYGFSSHCKIIAFTGDNPASLAGMKPGPGDIIVSLGTSDTVLIWLTERPARPSVDGVILVNPLNTQHYLGMLCFKNGSLTREKIKKKISRSEDWVDFDELLTSTPPGNQGNIGIYFDVHEITPNAVGIYRYNAENKPVEEFSAAVEVRGVIESQFLSRRVYCEDLGYNTGSTGRILATGGASSNKAILQVLADVFNAPVFTQSVANSACLGSAFRAKHGLHNSECHGDAEISYESIFTSTTNNWTCCAQPNMNAAQIYKVMSERYRELERIVTSYVQ